MCSESVRGITAGTEERDAVPAGPGAAPREDSKGAPLAGVSVVQSSSGDLHGTPVPAGALRSQVSKPYRHLKDFTFIADFEKLEASSGPC